MPNPQEMWNMGLIRINKLKLKIPTPQMYILKKLNKVLKTIAGLEN